MIIVEGPDGGGKTTLITMLAEALDLEVEPRACTSENGIDMTTLANWVDNDLVRSGRPRGLHDRYPLISEPIYGPLTRGRMADGFEDLDWLSTCLSTFYDLQPTIIYCIPPLDVMRANVQANHPMTTTHMREVNSAAKAIWHAYCHRAALDLSSGEGTLVWDYTAPNASEYLEVMIRDLREFG